MSLSVPYVLRAALEQCPEARVGEGKGALPVHAVEEETRRIADQLWRSGYGDGGVLPLRSEPLEQLAAVRIGVPVGQRARRGAQQRTACDLEVLESAVWSETVLARLPGVLTHGQFLAAPQEEREPRELSGLAMLIRGLEDPQRSTR